LVFTRRQVAAISNTIKLSARIHLCEQAARTTERIDLKLVRFGRGPNRRQRFCAWWGLIC
jgi:hypothetical protein